METIVDVWDDPNRIYPSIVYIETINYCNAVCVSCLNHRCKRTRGIMKISDFKTIVDKVKEHGLKVGAMFCFGEPLMDNTLLDKFEYGKKIDIFMPHIGFNTNVTFLTPEKYDRILANCPNIVLSFFNVGKEYERLTGNLSWEDNYKRATDFIKYRDKYSPDFPIYICTNKIAGSNQEKVKEAFGMFNVGYFQDAELRWGGKVMTGIIDRTIMFRQHRCDGHKGALQIKYDGSCEFCAYDIIGTPDGGETKFANILTDSWEEINRKFKEKWRNGCSLCLRCDNWHQIKTVIDNNYERPNPLPPDWYEWQKPYLRDGEGFYD